MNTKIKYDFLAKLWKDQSWVFVSLPKKISKEIRDNLKWQEEGWGRMKAMACINKIEWDTAIWFDTKANTYLLPVKAEIRKKGNLQLDETMAISVWV